MKILSAHPQGSIQWLRDRQKGITSTEASVIMGVNPYKTAQELYEEKKGAILQTDSNWFLERGKAMEPVLRQHFSDYYEKKVLNFAGIVQHQNFDWMIASLDGYSEDNHLVEFKTSSSKKGWGEPSTDEIPLIYMFQVQHALCVTGLDACHLGVSFFGMEPVYYYINRNVDIINELIERERKFWTDLLNDTPPEPQTIDELQNIIKVDNNKNLLANDETQDLYGELKYIKDQITNLEANKKELEEKIKTFMLKNDGSILIDKEGNKLVSFNEAKPRTSIDSKLLQQNYPEAYNNCVKSGNPYRIFKLY